MQFVPVGRTPYSLAEMIIAVALSVYLYHCKPSNETDRQKGRFDS